MLGQHPLTQHPSLTAILETNSINPNISKQASKLSSCRALLLRQSVLKRQSSQERQSWVLRLKGATAWIWTICPGVHVLRVCPCGLGGWLETFQKEPKWEVFSSLWVNPVPSSCLLFPSLRCHKVSDITHSSAMMRCPTRKPQSLPNSELREFLSYCPPSLFSCSLSHKNGFIYYIHPKNVLHMCTC